MSTDFGVVSNYISERGFGFVRGLLPGNSPEVFFHIKTIKKTDPQLATRISSAPFSGDFHFWFETEVTPKGAQVRVVLSTEQIRQGAITDPTRLIERVESYWRNFGYQKPSWLDDVTSDLVGRNRTDELSLERGRLEAEEQEKRQRQRDVKRAQEQLEEDEFQNLVAEMTKFGFTHSSQVSNYIVSNHLGYKYKNISGILQMELDGTAWNFKGGFPQNIYARLCIELGLENQGSRARPLGFTPYKEIT